MFFDDPTDGLVVVDPVTGKRYTAQDVEETVRRMSKMHADGDQNKPWESRVVVRWLSTMVPVWNKPCPHNKESYDLGYMAGLGDAIRAAEKAGPCRANVFAYMLLTIARLQYEEECKGVN